MRRIKRSREADTVGACCHQSAAWACSLTSGQTQGVFHRHKDDRRAYPDEIQRYGSQFLVIGVFRNKSTGNRLLWEKCER